MNRFPSHAVHPDEAVAIGAGVQAGLKARDVALKEVVMTDVCPYTLGVDDRPSAGRAISCAPASFSPIIERNTISPRPAGSETYSTLQANQRKVGVQHLPGRKSQRGRQCAAGRDVGGRAAGPGGEIEIEVRFTYDINGLLEVDMHVPKTGERRELVILGDENMTAGAGDRPGARCWRR